MIILSAPHAKYESRQNYVCVCARALTSTRNVRAFEYNNFYSGALNVHSTYHVSLD